MCEITDAAEVEEVRTTRGEPESGAGILEIWDTFSQTIGERRPALMSDVWKRGESFTVSFTTQPNAASSADAATE
jgi:hypothetical protein